MRREGEGRVGLGGRQRGGWERRGRVRQGGGGWEWW